jgi:hypothetical protein
MKKGLFRVTFLVRYDSKRELKDEELLFIKKTVDSLVEAIELRDRVLFSVEQVPLKSLEIFSEDNLNKLLTLK